MQTSFWSPFGSDATIKAICWTLIHSLWIGLIIALLCGIVIATTRKSAAALRYRLLCGLLVLFVASMAVTYGIELRTNSAPSLPWSPVVVVFVANPSAAQQVTTVLNRSLVDRTKDLLNQNLDIIFIAWLLFFILKSLKVVSGLLYIRRIRNYKTHDIGEELKHRIEYLSSQIGIGRTVRLVQSELVKVPVAVGWLKPMILLPVGIVFQLTPEQLDGILWHELAHIRRRDYLVNILQGIVETVFFFNPGLLWLSSLIRTEREACCDDMVLIRMNQKANYLEALLSFGYGEFSQAQYAMSVGSGKQLRDRLKRMISRENRRLGVVEKVVLITGVVLLSAFAGLRQVNKKYIRPATDAAAEKVAPKAATTNVLKQGANSKGIDMPHGKIDSLVSLSSMSSKKGDYPGVVVTEINAEDIHGEKYHLTLSNNKLVAMELNGKRIKHSDLAGYQYMADMFQNKGKADGVIMAKRLVSGEFAASTLAFGADTTVLLFNRQYEWSRTGPGITYYLSASDASGKRYHFTITRTKLVALTVDGNDVEKSGLGKYAYLLKHVPPPPPPPPAKPGSPVLQGTSANKTDTLSMAHLIRQPDKPQEPTPPQAPPSLDKMIADVTNDLITEHIIKDKSGLSTFKLTYSELLVNGVKQPDDIQKKFAAKYYPGNARVSKDPNYGLWYNAKTHGVALGTFNIDLDAL